MAEFYYDCTLDEWWPLLRAIIEEHSVLFAVDWWYPSPKCEYHDRLDESLKSHVLKTKRRVFFVGEAFSDGPLLLHQQSAGPRAGEYSIDLTRGGPMLDFIMPAQFQERGITWFSSGRLTFQKRFWNDSYTEAYPPPKALKDAFGLIKRTVQRRLLEKRVEKEKRWISTEAWELFEAGKAAFRIAGKCFTVKGEVQPPTPWRRKPIFRPRDSM